MSNSQSLASQVRAYLDRRVITIYFLGIAQGFPWLIIGSALTLWLQESGLSRTTIGYAGAIFLAYSINFLWSPLVDRVNLGPLQRLFGSRRAWILLMQSAVILACLSASRFSPLDNLQGLIFSCIAIAFAAATQDIAIDAFRIDSIPDSEPQELAAAASMITAGWWTGYAGIGVFPLWLSDQPNWDWNNIYVILAGIMACLMIPPLLAKEPITSRQQEQDKLQTGFTKLIATQDSSHNTLLLVMLIAIPTIAVWALLGSKGVPNTISASPLYIPLVVLAEFILIGLIFRRLWNLKEHQTGPTSNPDISNFHQLLGWLIITLIQPLRDFFLRNGFKLAFSLLAFIFTFKMGEAFLGRMSVVFYKEVGFSNTDIAFFSKLLTWGVTIVFSLLGGLANIRYGIVKGLLISGIAMASTNLLFAVMAMIGPVKWFFAFTVITDGFSQAWSSVAFVSVMSLLCNRTFSASQYALMVSLGALGRTLISSTSGQVVDWLDGNWVIFFILTTLLVIPSLIILVKIGKDISALEGNGHQGTTKKAW